MIVRKRPSKDLLVATNDDGDDDAFVLVVDSSDRMREVKKR
jgi:hypothetical protein